MMSPHGRTRRQRQLWLLSVIHLGFCGIIAHLERFGPADLRLTVLVLLPYLLYSFALAPGQANCSLPWVNREGRERWGI